MAKLSTDSGNIAEAVVAQKLRSSGYKILDQNWRTKRCEIDIVATKSDKVYFVEVKYRNNSRQGSGVEYITSTKLRQMEYSAQTWVSHNDWSGEAQLVVAEVSGDNFTNLSLIFLD